jgi:hypothetical protein
VFLGRGVEERSGGQHMQRPKFRFVTPCVTCALLGKTAQELCGGTTSLAMHLGGEDMGFYS